MMIRFIACIMLAMGSFTIVADSAEAGIFGRRSRPARTYSTRGYNTRNYSARSYNLSSRSGPYVVRGQSPIPMHVSPARYRYLKTFYPNQVRDVR